MIILGWIVFGALTGWLASLIVGNRGQGCFINIALGLLGAVAGGALFHALTGWPFVYEVHSLIVQFLVAVIGAVIVLAVWNALTGRR